MIRLFAGLSLPESLRRRLALLAGGLPGARWTPPENLHLTLRFIGEVDETLADDIDAALSGVRSPAFSLELGGLGTFGGGRKPHHLWLGAAHAAGLFALQEKIESALVRAGCPAEGRRFAPHVSLARLTDAPAGRLGDFIAGNNLFRAEIDVPFSSHLGRGEPIHRAERDYPLGDG